MALLAAGKERSLLADGVVVVVLDVARVQTDVWVKSPGKVSLWLVGGAHVASPESVCRMRADFR